ncbi:MAG: branched-chain amino acid ABC transporter permease [Alphaproteobacteria bacterium]|jgi:branched-chain amino acid transport system permease protein|nr:branched-chain amino acid ABC transporter permease [Rhodospirillaceae bacterium]MDG2482522.1 branched-chain amino acid ABC transporter permease [Alphaproteobacteria bacterium]MBT6203677.1 branched-chain amino acid ABC transporter permease [Rhodospirillaceae bacterium]MBT6511780.1 branched-chain amino acid ABC transporter permease [Rhodospirillaceae bacterium]MBT7612015.1 branched-chain amino acid ABC transporter permease [Rhodospirillaceae bacterium]
MIDNIQLLFDAPFLLLQVALDGILFGAIFAIAAYGMALVWGVMNVINIVQGEFVMLGGFITFQLTLWGINPFFGIPIAAAVLFVFGIALYYVVIRRVVDKDMFISLLATFGLSILLQQLMNQIWGGDVRTVQSGLSTWFLFDYTVTVGQIKVVAGVGALLLGLILIVFLKKSRLGQAIRATAQNPRAARVLGIDTDKVFAATYGINAALCGAAGALVVMAYSVHPYIGLPYTVRSFMIVIVAGLGNLPGVIMAGLGLGAAENFAAFILGAQFQVAFVFCLLVVILVVRNTLLRRQRKYLK